MFKTKALNDRLKQSRCNITVTTSPPPLHHQYKKTRGKGHLMCNFHLNNKWLLKLEQAGHMFVQVYLPWAYSCPEILYI